MLSSYLEATAQVAVATWGEHEAQQVQLFVGSIVINGQSNWSDIGQVVLITWLAQPVARKLFYLSVIRLCGWLHPRGN